MNRAVGGHPDEPRIPDEIMRAYRGKQDQILVKYRRDGNEVEYYRVGELDLDRFASLHSDPETTVVPEELIGTSYLVANGI